MTQTMTSGEPVLHPPVHRPAARPVPAPRSRWWRLPLLRRIAAAQDLLRDRLTEAAALEEPRPERFGFRLTTASQLYLITAFLYRRYFRVDCHGLEDLPAGPLILVANHGSRVLAWDGAMIITACVLEAEPPRLVHGMAEHRLMTLPVLARAARRIGATDGRREICIDLLRAGATVLAFPEGVRALQRPFRERYRLTEFGHGFVHVALATGAPIVPVAVIGAEEEAPLLANPAWLARLVGTPVAPLTPTVVVPLPVKYRLHFGAPIWCRGVPSRENVARHVALVRGMLQTLVHRGLAARSHVFF
jgi:1-acyl-sn-glycerol-3-phosphate acyltransferase